MPSLRDGTYVLDRTSGSILSLCAVQPSDASDPQLLLSSSPAFKPRCKRRSSRGNAECHQFGAPQQVHVNTARAHVLHT